MSRHTAPPDEAVNSIARAGESLGLWAVAKPAEAAGGRWYAAALVTCKHGIPFRIRIAYGGDKITVEMAEEEDDREALRIAHRNLKENPDHAATDWTPCVSRERDPASAARDLFRRLVGKPITLLVDEQHAKARADRIAARDRLKALAGSIHEIEPSLFQSSVGKSYAKDRDPANFTVDTYDARDSVSIGGAYAECRITQSSVYLRLDHLSPELALDVLRLVKGAAQ